MPEPRTWALIPSWEWHRAGVDNKRASTILRAVGWRGRFEEAVGMEPGAAQARLEFVCRDRAVDLGGDRAAESWCGESVTVGVPFCQGIVGYALAGDRDADDSVMLSLLEPYAGQRHRAARLILLSGRAPARRVPRMPRGDIGRL